MKKTKIDWCDCTINPVVGCKNGCEYCYAEKLNKRFNFIDEWSKPQFFPERLQQLCAKSPKSIFIDSMSDCGHWTIPQIRKIAEAINDNPQHNYILLTKRPDLFIEKCKLIVEDANHGNIWVGTTITRREDFNRLLFLPIYAHRFVSVEPLLEDLGDLSKEKCDLFNLPYIPEVIIIGAETGNRKNKIVVQKEWVKNIVDSANAFNEMLNSNSYEGIIMRKNNWKPVMIFMKESLKDTMGNDFRQDKLPWNFEKER